MATSKTFQLTSSVLEGEANHTVEVIGEPNRPASVRVLRTNGEQKVGDLPKYAPLPLATSSMLHD